MSKVLITGAASGLGRALALRFAREGDDICIADINMEGAEETLSLVKAAGGNGFTYNLDVTKPEQWDNLVEEVQQRWQRIDVVINNAGVATGDRIEQGEWSTWEWVIDINLKSVALGCRAFTPMMKQQGNGHFINTASLAGLMTAPLMASYNVTKAAVVALSDTMHHELKPYGIGTTVLCPGFFRTNLDKGMRTSDPQLLKMVDKVFESSELTADDVANICYRDMKKNKLICNPHKMGRRAYFIKRFMPFLFSYMVGKTAAKMKKHDPAFSKK
ncbi:MAG TPA: short chain dehydrogenase [Oceanospirillales bacterium]|jgi:NAD(P)-dependent dehydrogenase (short-subunit alcohol dehydrogenase family)|nr:short chain dehydrogenase [Oceanospirillales bacterium]|tara:strand:- start:3190 stop:4008 length:819 start_codon:yes stop_codon:yes gene_type:complete